MAARSEFAPFVSRGGRLCLEDVDLVKLAAALDGRAAWMLSHAAIAAAIRVAERGNRTGLRRSGTASPEARCVDVAAVGPPAVLTQIAAAGWWARVRSSHELQLALAAGFPPTRRVAAGGVRDDGFVKDALAAGVAVMEHDDATERANAARIGALLDHELPPHDGAPPDAPARLLARCGGLLAPVLRPPPALAVDAAWSATRSVRVLALRSGEGSCRGTARGLAGSGPPRPADVPQHVLRGDWVVIRDEAAALKPVAHGHPAPLDVLVRGGSWRILEPRPLPHGSA